VISDDGSFSQPTPDDIRAMKLFIEEERGKHGQSGPFDIVVEGLTPGDNSDKAAEILVPLAEAGVTWWVESMWTAPGGRKAVLKRIRQGPPQVR
jgi:hypothetical protein